MKTNSLLLLLLLACAPLHAAEPSLIVGKWQFAHGKDVTDACRSAYTEYRSDGTSINVSGENVSTSTYHAVPHKSGFLIKKKPVADNGKPNCQGISSTTVNKNTPPVFYVEVSRTEMRFFAVDNLDRKLFTFVRVPVK
jgi:hypothetical protein